ncbi:hypothetical protein PZA11_002578 [Diplocarpon coronariae]
MSELSLDDTTNLLALSPTQYTKSGIGGYGNIRPSSSFFAAPSSPRLIPAPSKAKGSFTTGIGGFGNLRSCSEHASIPREDFLARESTRKSCVAGSWYHGIGGAGNRSSSAGVSESEASSLAERGSRNLFRGSGRQSGADWIKGRLANLFRSRRSSIAEYADGR